MSDTEDRRKQQLTEEEVAELRRKRKTRTTYAVLFALGGFAAAVYAAFWKDAMGLTALFMGTALIGAGYADPNEVRGLWK